MSIGLAQNILITSSAAKVPLVRAMKAAAARILPTAKVIAGDADPGAATRYVADDFWEMPHLADTSPDALVEICHTRGVGTVFPTRDGELLFWSHARELFAEAGIDVVISAPDSVERCLDKLEFSRFGEAQGLPFIPAALDPAELGDGPFVVKERFGAGGRSIGLDLDYNDALAHARYLEAPVVQPYVNGFEISIDAWMDKRGAPRGLALRRRDRVIRGESQITTTFRDAMLEAEALAVLRALALRGPAVLQAIVLPGGGMRVVECNCRFGGASTASLAVGLDMLYWSLAERHLPEVTPDYRRIDGELRQVRVSEDLIFHDFDL